MDRWISTWRYVNIDRESKIDGKYLYSNILSFARASFASFVVEWRMSFRGVGLHKGCVIFGEIGRSVVGWS